MEDRLRYIFGLVNDWLKFAETKNAALVVAVSALLVVVCDHFPDAHATPWVRWSCIVGCALLVVGGAVSLVSFIPDVNFKWLSAKCERRATHNLFFFGEIAQYSEFDFLDALYDAESLPNQHKKLEADLAGQIVKNSQITVRKFAQFKIACWIAVIGIVALAISAVLHVTR